MPIAEHRFILAGEVFTGRVASVGMAAVLMLLAAWPLGAAEHAVILQYHHVGEETPAATSVTPGQFEQHLDYLADQGFSVWPLERVVEHLTAHRALPERCVAITFDDAYASVYEEAFPRLRARGWPFTVFVPTDGVDRGLAAYATWAQMREMAAGGARFANHSATHDHLVRRRSGEGEAAWGARVRADIGKAQARLAAELGDVPRLLAYPYGEYDPALAELVRGLGFVALGQQSGPAWHGSDPAALPRFALSVPYADPEVFAVRVHSLPLPVLESTPRDPVLALDEWRPLLRLTLGEGDYRAQALACYASGQGRIPVTRVSERPLVVEVRASEPLAVGRSRYNCTAPSADGERYHWFSQVFLRRTRAGEWYRE